MKRFRVLALLWATALFGALAVSARAATITVNSLADSGAGTLRQAIAAAISGDTINFAVTGTITLTSGELAIGRNVTIVGPGPASLTVSGNNASRVFNIGAGASQVSISALTISNGRVIGATAGPGGYGGDAQGGGVLNNGTLHLGNCVISGNSATGGVGDVMAGSGYGGGVFNSGVLTLSGCTLTGNVAVGGNSLNGSPGGGLGGALANQLSLVLLNCTLSANSARGGWGGPALPVTVNGGGIWSANTTVTSVANCTVSGNSSTGGRAYTVRGGAADGGGISCSQGLSIQSTIVAGNSATGGPGSPNGSAYGPDVYSSAAVSSVGYNLIGEANDSSGWVATDLRGSTSYPLDPLLGPLQDNGGPTPTMALLAGSTAIDNGKSFGSYFDQRGLPRPVDLPAYSNATGGDASDIGAYEVQQPAVDIGLRAYDGTATIKIACESGPLTSPLRIGKNGTTYGILLVPPTAVNASKLRIQTASGTKALQKLP